MPQTSFMKHFLFLICFLFVLAQCSKSEGNKDWTLNANSVELHRGETFLLTATQANVSFESSNQFVCGVSTSGTITGYHIGEAYINVTDGIKTYSCKVTVSPKYDMYTEPVVDWTLDRDGVKARYPNVTSWYYSSKYRCRCR